MAKMTPRTLSGFMELLPAPQQQMERIMEVLRKTYSLYGFTPLQGLSGRLAAEDTQAHRAGNARRIRRTCPLHLRQSRV